jgi:hypothetical protein
MTRADHRELFLSYKLMLFLSLQRRRVACEILIIGGGENIPSFLFLALLKIGSLSSVALFVRDTVLMRDDQRHSTNDYIAISQCS